LHSAFASNGHVEPYDDPPVQPSVLEEWQQTTVDEIIKLVNQSPNKQCDLDPIPTFLLKQCIDILAPVITSIVNRSLHSGIFPDSFKLAIIRPLLKKPSLDKDQFNNYRPVSNLSFLSKLTERVVKIRLDHHLSSNSLYNKFQSAYSKFHSTETALLSLHDHMIKAMSRQEVTGLCLLDLSAAFDTIDHSILIHRLQSWFGISNTALSWFASYLSSRVFRVAAGNDTMSASFPQNCGVPQGSVLGPLLFILYTTPLSHLISNHDVNHHLYADDTQLYISFVPKSFNVAKLLLQSAITSISNWMTANLLTLNPDKTEFLIIGQQHQLDKLSCTSLSLPNNVNIIPTTSAKNLGIFFDSNLTFKEQITQVTKSCFYHIKDFRRIRPVLDFETAKTVAVSIIQSKLDYCNSLYLGLPTCATARLQLIQNAIARVVTNTPRREHISPILKALHWLPVKQRITFKVMIITHSLLHSSRPKYLFDLLDTSSTGKTRSATSLTLRRHPVISNRKLIDRSFQYAIPALWNSLPADMRQMDPVEGHHSRPTLSHSQFRRRLKTYLFQAAYPT
jgi:hypothetical protein